MRSTVGWPGKFERKPSSTAVTVCQSCADRGAAAISAAGISGKKRIGFPPFHRRKSQRCCAERAQKATAPRAASSVVRRHREARAMGPRAGPALHHGLVARVEPHAFLAIDVVIAEQAALPTAERVECHGHGDRHVDAYHAGLDAPRKLARNAAVARVARDAVAVLVSVRELDGGGEV